MIVDGSGTGFSSNGFSSNVWSGLSPPMNSRVLLVVPRQHLGCCVQSTEPHQSGIAQGGIGVTVDGPAHVFVKESQHVAKFVRIDLGSMTNVPVQRVAPRRAGVDPHGLVKPRPVVVTSTMTGNWLLFVVSTTTIFLVPDPFDVRFHPCSIRSLLGSVVS